MVQKTDSAIRTAGVLKIADRILELSSYDAIQFDYVATVILEEFTDMNRTEIVAWVQNQHAKWHMALRRLNA